MVCAEYFNTEAVVIAKVLSSRYVAPTGAQDYYLYTLQASQTLRGTIKSTFVVYEENSSGRAPFEWERGHSYLLFLYCCREKQDYVVDGCGNSSPIEQAGNVLQRIGAIRTAKGGLIDTGVWFNGDEGWDKHARSFEVRRDDGKQFSGQTNRDGRVVFHVPPGHYRVMPKPPLRLEVDDLFTYEDPNDITIVNGSCAQVQFMVKTNESKR